MPEYLAPGVFVEEVSFRAKSIEGVSTSTCGFTGPTRRGPIRETPELITSFGEFERTYGGYAALSFQEGQTTPNYMAHAVRAFFENGGRRLYVARTYVPRTDNTGNPVPGMASHTVPGVFAIRARFPGSGYNGRVHVYLKATRLAGQTPLSKAKEGALIRVSTTDVDSDATLEAAAPAQLDGGLPAFFLKPGDELSLQVSGNPGTIQFTAEPAVVEGQDLADPAQIAIPDDTRLTLKVNDNPELVLDLPAGNITAQDLALWLNNRIDHAKVDLVGDRLVIRTDRKGSLARLAVQALPVLGFDDSSQTGGGSVGDIEAVSAEDINNHLTAADIDVRAFAVPDTGLLRLATTATGQGARLQAAASDAQRALGLPTGQVQGSDGLAFTYYTKIGSQWKDAANNDFVVDDDSRRLIQLMTFNLEAVDADDNRRVYENLGFGAGHPRYIGTVLAATPASKMEQIENPYYFAPESNALTAFTLRDAMFGSLATKSFDLTNGSDGAEPTKTSPLQGAVAYGDALELLAAIDDIAIVAAPGYAAYHPTTYRDIQNALITHAENMKYRIAVLDTPPNNTLQGAREARSRIDSSYAAMYYPWVTVSNPLWRPGNDQIPREINVPPSGFVAGIYARTDINRGVWKAPANEIVRGALRFEQEINRGQQEVLNPEGINCLRFFFGRGYRVWGARTASSDPEWKYVNIRRYFIYLEHSIDRSTQWAVFEPNGQRLWSNITDTVSAFLYNEWRSGALLGASPEQAFFVRCDRSTMTQADLDNGRLICEVGVAAIKPAEFVIFRIGQKTADAD